MLGVPAVIRNVVGAGRQRRPPMEADMGLMDKVKAQATVLAQKTQETAREGKARLDQATAGRHADVMLRNLGALVYAEQTGRAASDSADQVARLVSQLSAHEAENGINLAAQYGGWNPAVPGQGGPSQGFPGPAGPGPGSPGQGGSAPFGGAAPGDPGQGAPGQGMPGQQPFGGPPPSGPGAAGQPFGGPAAGSGYTQPEYTFPPPPSGDDDSSYPPEPGSTPSS
jgi:hypothetical protein